MKFKDLNKKDKMKAVNEYIKGWKETHPEETLSIKVATECCYDINDCVEYVVGR